VKTFLRLLALHRPHAGWLLLGGLLALLTLLANVVLMTTSGWFIAAMGLAGVAGVTMNYFTPAAIIRACAIVRTTGRYGERLVTHDATLRLLSRLRTWLYGVLEPLAPAGLSGERAGDLLSRFTADIDTLDNFYLRILLPMGVALVAVMIMVAWLWWQSPFMALVTAALLLLAGLLFPALLAWHGGRAGRQALEAEERLRTRVAEILPGLGELLLYGGDTDQARWLAGQSDALGRAQLAAGRWTSAGQSLVSFCAWLTLWLLLVLAAPAVQAAQRPPEELAMLALFALASFEAVAPLPLAFQSLAPAMVPPSHGTISGLHHREFDFSRGRFKV
jgi:ATP-binding cassette subfamily C protein CydC